MKRLFLPLMVLCLLFVGKAQAQEELTVCDGTSTNSYVPVYGLWMDDYTRCEMIYPAEMIDDMTNGMITSLTFYISSPATGAWTGNEFNVYLMEVDATTLSAYYGSANAEVVYSGSIDGQGQTMTIAFDDPFMYTGGNLLVGIEEPVASTYHSCSFYGVEATGASASGYSSASLDGVTFNERNFLPKVTFAYEAGSVDCAKPKNIVFSDITAHEVNVSWTAGGSETMWLVGIMAVDDSTDYQGNYTMTPSYSFSNLQGERQYQVGVVAVCDAQSQLISEPRYAYFTTEESCPKPSSVVVSNIAPHGATVSWAMSTFTHGFFDFEDGALPNGWTSEGDGQWSVGTGDYSATTGAASGTQNAKITHLTTGNVTYLVTGAMDFSGLTSCTVSLSYVNRQWLSDIDYFGVCYRVNGGEWNELFATTEAHSDWTQLALQLPAEALVANCQIGFRHTDKYGYGLGVDAIAIGEPVAPDFPFNLRYRAVGENDWTYEYDIDAMSYDLEYLAAETEYEVQVQSSCGGDDGTSAWVSTTFTTDIACPAPTGVTASNIGTTTADINWNGYAGSYIVHYRPATAGGLEEDFENGLPDNWTIIDADGDGYNWYSHINTGYGNHTAHSGDGVMSSESYSNDASAALTPDNWLITPLVALGGTASFWYIGQDPDYAAEHFGVYVSTSGLNVSNFQSVSSEIVATGEYQECVVDLSSFAGQVGYVAIRHFNVTDQFILNIDDFTVTGDASTEAEWIEVTTDDPSVVLDQLDPDTAYEVEVMGDCTSDNDGYSTWSQLITFTTLPTCPRPTNVTVSDITGHEATITWNAGYEETLWNVILGNEVYEVDETSITLTDLDPETEYTVEVIAVCTADDSSQPASVTFTTDIACPAPTALDAANVTTNSADVSWDGSSDSYIVRYRIAPPTIGINENFDNGMPAGWTTIDADGDGYNWVAATSAAGVYFVASADISGTGHESSYDFMVSGSYENVGQSALTPDNYLVTPQITINSENATLSFWACGQDAGYAAEHFGVAISTTNNTSASAFTTIQEWTLTAKKDGSMMNARRIHKDLIRGQNRAQGSWYEFTVDLGDYAGQNVYVAIRHFNVTDQFVIDLDDFVITDEPAEVDPWVEITTTDLEATLSELQDDTIYEFQVMGDCGDVDGQSAWSESEYFTTLFDGINENVAGINVWNRANEIRVDLANDGNYTMNVVNILGQTVMTSNVNGMGSHIVKHNLTPGVYVVTLSSSENSLSTKIVVR